MEDVLFIHKRGAATGLLAGLGLSSASLEVTQSRIRGSSSLTSFTHQVEFFWEGKTEQLSSYRVRTVKHLWLFILATLSLVVALMFATMAGESGVVAGTMIGIAAVGCLLAYFALARTEIEFNFSGQREVYYPGLIKANNLKAFREAMNRLLAESAEPPRAP